MAVVGVRGQREPDSRPLPGDGGETTAVVHQEQHAGSAVKPEAT